MEIEIWSDFACPYCYIGKARMHRVLRALGAENLVTITMKSFELDPQTSKEVTTTTPERFARKYGLSLHDAQTQIEHISQMGREEGLDFRYATTQYSNMLDAHRLAKYGQSQHHPEIHEKLFAAYFTSNLNLADHQILAQIARQVGLDADATLAMLASNQYEDAVRKDEYEASILGVHGVPYFYIDKKIAISGVQPYNMMLNTFSDCLAKEQTQTSSSSMMCGANGCQL